MTSKAINPPLLARFRKYITCMAIAAGLNGYAVDSIAQEIGDNRLNSASLTVLTFNVAGLPWPVASGRGDAMRQIAREVKKLSEQGPAIDVLLIQEGFIEGTLGIADAMDMRHRISGASPKLRSADHICFDCQEDTRQRKWWKGETISPILGSGLHIFSAHPIVEVRRLAFGPDACAGYDCLANKGAVLATIMVEGVPQPIDVINTHLNSTNSAGVPKWETHIAHERQVSRLAEFWNQNTPYTRPAIMGGDINIQDSHTRFVPFARSLTGARFVKNTCTTVGGPTRCAIDMDPKAPWLTSQDVQAFRSGQLLEITPVAAKTVFSEPIEGELLSDHFGLLVRYRLSWKPGRSMDSVALQR